MKLLDKRQASVTTATNLAGMGFSQDDINKAKMAWVGVYDDDLHLEIDRGVAVATDFPLSKGNVFVIDTEIRDIIPYLSFVADSGTSEVNVALFG